MKRKAKTAWVYFIAVVILAAGFILSNNAIRESQSSKAALSYYGSRGREVIEIQKRLKAWGYYKDTRPIRL
jgi:N-acetylmuramoyl-L-alanine amidase